MLPPFLAPETDCAQGSSVLPVGLGFPTGPLGGGAASVRVRRYYAADQAAECWAWLCGHPALALASGCVRLYLPPLSPELTEVQRVLGVLLRFLRVAASFRCRESCNYYGKIARRSFCPSLPFPRGCVIQSFSYFQTNNWIRYFLDAQFVSQ